MTNRESIIAITPAHVCDPQIAIAACRAGQVGILDLGLQNNPHVVVAALDKLAYFVGENGRWGIRWDTLGIASRSPAKLTEYVRNQVPVLVLVGVASDKLVEMREQAERVADQIFLEVYDFRSAQAAHIAGYNGVIVKGHEASGWVSNQSSFILLQELHEKLDIQYWIQGGMGLHTAAAAVLAGATGMVLCEQLWLTEEGPFSPGERSVWSKLDGSETVLVGRDDEVFRLYSRSGRDKLRELGASVVRDGNWHGMLVRLLTEADEDPLIPLGHDIALAAALSKRYGTVGRVIAAFCHSISSHLELAKAQQPLAPKSALAKLHGTEYPIVQGPMARVSDVVPFAKAVAEGGGLPFLALSVMRGPEVRRLLTKAKAQLSGVPWGVGILGFIPLALRQEQFEVFKEISPSFAIVAGGRPSQVRELEAYGISTYLHVPSAVLLKLFIKEGIRKFILEGSEGGGHVGPRTSFILWESAVETLLGADIEDLEAIQILFAGGIHDALSGAMVASLAAPLTARGIKVGVLMGSAYLFTKEALHTDAILREFQIQALKCNKTVLLQSKVGHATRCVKTPFCDDFNKTKQQLALAGKSDEEIFETLERLNIGRLRIASKGITRNPEAKTGNGSDRYINLNTNTQQRQGLYMLGELATLRNATLSIADLHAAVSTGSALLLAKTSLPLSEQTLRVKSREDIAIIGMACIFPGARNLRAFWKNILNGENAIREVSEDRWRPADFFDPNRLTPDKTYSKWGAFLDDIQFDPTKYGIPPASLSSIEPMQLLALEVASHALEDAGFDRLPFPRKRTAVVFGTGGIHDLAIDYIFRTMLTHYLPRVAGLSEKVRQHIINSLRQELPEWNEDSFPGILSNVVAGRVANRLGLCGSNFTVDAACASSLAALDVGINRLRSGDADVILVGAVDCSNNAVSYMAFSKTQALSPQGCCRPFDKSTDGIVISEGAAALVLKRLGDAESDGDRIYAVIKGIGSSSDGRNRSLTAPHPQGQVLAIRRAYVDAQVDPSTVELMEAHGTGTVTGDKAEIESLNLAFGDVHTVRQYCAVGSVKSMIGHTKVASGLASMIKSVLALKHRLLPATLGVEVPNSLVDFTHTPFYINTETRPWFDTHKGRPRRCGVSSFGFGGINFHAVLEEYARDYRSSNAIDLTPRGAEIFALNRDKRFEIIQAVERLIQGLEYPDCIHLSQFAYSVHLEESRRRSDSKAQTCRLVIVATSVSDLKQKLQMALRELKDKTDIRNPQGMYYGEIHRASGSVCFLFPGQGSQKIHMLRDIVATMPALHDVFEQADVLLQDRLPQPLSRYIYPLPAFSNEERHRQQTELNATHVAQPALGVVDIVAFKVLEVFGLQPDFVAGHSYGEYVALCAAGVISQDDLIRLSEIRGRIVAQASKTNPGAMAAVKADEESVRAVVECLELSVTLANMNTPDQTVIAGSVSAVEQAIVAMGKEGLTARKIPVTAAFHTSAMSKAGEALRRELEKVEFREPGCRVYSNTLGDLYPDSPDATRNLLGRHISEPVRFLEQIRKLYQDGARVFIEVGPGRVLGGLVDRILTDDPHTTLHIDAPGRPGWVQLAHLLAQGLILGLPVDLNCWFKDRRLADIELDTVFDQAHARAKPGPLIYRVNGRKVTPWNKQDSTKSPKLEPSAASSVTPAMPGSMPTTIRDPTAGPWPTQPQTRARNNENTMTMTQNNSPNLLSQIQVNMSQFMELQRQQQQIMQRVLDIQEQLMSTALRGEAPTLPDQAAQSAQAQHKPHTAAAPQQVQTVPPAPVLPKMVVAPSIIASNLTPAALSLVAPTAVKPAIPTLSQSAFGTDASKEPATTKQFQADLLLAVSKRTGYPEDMLKLDAHLEADLGIDSIKRVEIFSTLGEHHDLLEGRDEETLLEELAGLKTLRRIIEWYDTNRNRTLEGENASPIESLTPPLLAKADAAKSSETKVRRYVVKPVRAPLNKSIPGKDFPAEHLILLLGEVAALSAALHAALTGSEYRVRQIVIGKQTRVLGNDRFEVDFSSLDSLKTLRGLLTRSGETVGAVFNLMALAVTGDSEDDHLNDARQLFMLLKVFEKDLKESAQSGGGWLINFTALDGQFGLHNARAFPVGTAGTLGVAKSAAREWSGLRVKCIDVDLKMDPHMLIAQVLEELDTDDSLVEVGFTQEGRWKLDLAEDIAAATHVSRLKLDSHSVLLVTGGACGITAEITKVLAEKYQPQLVLIGRSSLPEAEAEATRSLQNPQTLRQFFIQELQAKNFKVTPAIVEQQLKRIMKDRQIRSNIAAMEDAGARVEYHALDVRDTEAFGKLIDEVYAKWGRIDGVLHGAGVIDDKLIRHKSVECFDTVFATKVIPAIVLANKLRPEMMRFLMFFSSVAARFGNVGQSDYSAANEVLNKLTDRLSHEWPEVHVVSINWGPWDSGMVSDELRKLYAAKEIHLVPADVGVRFALDELQGSKVNAPEVVIASSIKQISEWKLDKSQV
jgi:malonyl CoA-acyl carrier protein transacylase